MTLAELLHRWNWKSAVLSALVRSLIFATANLSAGSSAAWAAFWTEIWFRLATSGFYGGITQSLVQIEPEWKGMVATVVLLPALSHTLELCVHLVRGTPELARSILASVAFTIVSTLFDAFAMRRGLFLTGSGSAPLHRDLMRLPMVVLLFVSWPARAAWCGARRLVRPHRDGC